MNTLKNLLASSILFAATLSCGSLWAQSDCNNLQDPLFTYTPEFDPCCGQGGPPSVCYFIDDSEPYHYLTYFNYPGPIIPPSEWTGNEPFWSYSELAADMNNIFNAGFSWNSTDKSICATNPSSLNFGDIVICWTNSLYSPYGSWVECDTITPVINPGCNNLVTEPTYLGAQLLSPPSSIPSLPIAGGIMTGDMPSLNFPNATPSSASLQLIMNAMLESNALQTGAGCFNLNCIDLDALAEGFLLDPDFVTNLNTLIPTDDIPIPAGQNLSGWLVEQSKQALLENVNTYGSFTAYINQSLGFNIPDYPCDGGLVAPPQEDPFSGGGNTSRGRLFSLIGFSSCVF